ncbi:MAG: Hsp20/alpha crystallin family protein [Methanobacteriota archaeon]|nr:MAG: Hsp20/alpha crystallin family protein [Euryarchaeota archaeon]
MSPKKRRRSPFDDYFGSFDEEIERMREMMERMTELALSEKKDYEPFVYGFSVRTGPDGEPIMRRFGNAMDPGKGIEEGASREPMTDVIEREDNVSVTMELPGVEKEEIDLDVTSHKLTVEVDTPQRRYHKVVELPCRVDEKSVKATFKNGVLDITLSKTEESSSKRIEIG